MKFSTPGSDPMHTNPTRESEPSAPYRSRPDPSTNMERDDDSERDQSLIEPMTIATTDPLIEALVECQANWKRHPDVTTSVTTTQVGEPTRYPLPCLGMALSDKRQPTGSSPDDEKRTQESGTIGCGDVHYDDSPGPGEDAPVGGRDDRRVRPLERARRSAAIRRPHPSRLKDVLLIAGAGLIGGLIGAAGFLYFFRPRIVGNFPSTRADARKRHAIR
jgi:hypothetical protein